MIPIQSGFQTPTEGAKDQIWGRDERPPLTYPFDRALLAMHKQTPRLLSEVQSNALTNLFQFSINPPMKHQALDCST